MVEHLALYCSNVTGEVRHMFLEEVRGRAENTSKNVKTGGKQAETIESNKIESSKVVSCNRALTRLFVCCGIPFRVVSNPFFIDFVKSLCPEYELPNRVTFAGSWVNKELSSVTTIVLDDIKDNKNITLGINFFSLLFL
jgi:hypothetical protein